MSPSSTRHHTLLYNNTIQHTKTFFAPAYHPCKKTFSTSKYVSNKYSSQNIPLFTSLGLGLGLGLGLQPNQRLPCNWYKSLHATTQIFSYFYLYVICKYQHTHEDKGVLENPYSLPVLHTHEDRVVLGTPIYNFQREITLRESIIIFSL